jgi:Queuosine biosynthesis protein QueC
MLEEQIMFYKDNWFTWFYDDIEGIAKPSVTSKFTIKIKRTITTKVKNYYEELFDNARRIRDLFSGDLNLLFSGGIDSEVVLRCYRDLKIPINVYIFKYEDDLNYREFNHAIKVCTDLNVKYKVIDFNLQHFFENDAYYIWKKCKADSSGWLPHMKMIEYLDGIPIIGSGDPYWRRQDNGTWKFELHEGTKFWTTYHKSINRVVVSDWYEYSPEMIISHMQLPRIKALINDRIFGKKSSVSHKALIHQDYWNDIIIRPKLVGFEKDKPTSRTSKPEFMLEFEKTYTSKVQTTTYFYSAQELMDLICYQ